MRLAGPTLHLKLYVVYRHSWPHLNPVEQIRLVLPRPEVVSGLQSKLALPEPGADLGPQVELSLFHRCS
jgi:hypothetical protein